MANSRPPRLWRNDTAPQTNGVGYPRKTHALVAVTGTLVLATLFYSTTTGARMAAKYAPLSDAAVEIQYRVAIAHLWFEEFVSGDRHQDISTVWLQLDAAEHHVRAMLEGGSYDGANLIPLKDPQLREGVRNVLDTLSRFRDAAEKRLAALPQAMPGTEIDQEFDTVFASLLQQTEHLEIELQRRMNRDLFRFRTTQRLLMALCVILATVVGVALHRNRLRMAKDRQAIEHSKQEREQLIARLEAQNAELERFAYTVSHDLRTPLITVKGFLGLLQEDLATGNHQAVDDDIQRARRAADHMENLLHDLLNLSRIGHIANPIESICLHELVSEVLDLASISLAKLEVEVHVAADLPCIAGDRERLREVLQNLIENAIKYMGDQPEPRITIHATEGVGSVVCRVSDNGLGIAPEFQDRIFGLFQKLDPKSDGTGIGLALVKRIIEVHGGRIWVESEGQARGSSFCFELPTATATCKIA